MDVGIDDVLQVLAHELRTPVGVARGYVRLLLDDRIQDPRDRRRALERLAEALDRLRQLADESEACADSARPGPTGRCVVPARTVADAVARSDGLGSSIALDGELAPELGIQCDQERLVSALSDLIRLTARELAPTDPSRTGCLTRIGIADGRFQLLVGSSESIALLGAGPAGPRATPWTLDRGGVGLALIRAAIVLDGHGAARWTIGASRRASAVRLPLVPLPALA